jgi:ParB family chromosome partitioning protein
MTRKALGRGLGALLSAQRNESDEQPNELPIDLIDANRLQPRSYFDEGKLAELAQSIKANGIVQPVLVRRVGNRYELIAGERRLRAAKQAGLTKIPVIIREVPDEAVLELALIENIQREELTPIEEANSYKKLIETVGLTQEMLAHRIGRDRSYITNYLRLLRLPEDVQRLVEQGKLSAGHARALLATEDANAQRRLARKIISESLSVRQVEALLRRSQSGPSADKRKAVTPDANQRAAESKLRRALGTQVRLVPDRESAGGKIEIHYYDGKDLIRLYSLILGQQVPSGT